jgi:hypothetical protein
MYFGFINVISLYGYNRHVSATHVTKFRVVSAPKKNIYREPLTHLSKKHTVLVKIPVKW